MSRGIVGRVREVTIEDVRAYVEMLNRSEENWPWTEGVRFTEEMARERIEGSAAIGHYVMEVDKRIVGACIIHRGVDDEDSGYVGYLNVEPKYQGQGFGKRLLRAAVEKSIEEGLERVDLGTRSGNLKALPLYKKMGFFWVPETSIHMVNFIPIILNHPMFKEFFQKNPDWYSVQIRDLSPKPDILKRDGIRIYQYYFRSGVEEIRAVADRQGLWLTGGTNQDLDIWIHPEKEVGREGFVEYIVWEIENKGNSPIEVELLVEPSECAEIIEPPPKNFDVQPNQHVKLKGSFRIDPNSERKEHWDKPDRINTFLKINDQKMRFRTGIGRQAPLSFSYDPGLLLGYPGARTKLRVKLRNQTTFPLVGSVIINPINDLIRIKPKTHRFSVEPEAFAGFQCDVEIGQEASSSYLPVVFSPSFIGKDGEEIRGRDEILHASCVAPGDLLAYTDLEGRIVNLHNDLLSVSIDLRRGGGTSIRDRLTGTELISGPIWDSLGPPFWPPEFWHRRSEYSLERGDHFVKATIHTKSEIHEGLTLLRECILRSGWPILTIQYGLVNNHPKPRSLKLRSRITANLDKATIYLPTKYGLIYEDLNNRYPMGGHDAPEKPAEYAENWMALEGYTNRFFTVGTIWPWEADRLIIGGNSLAFPEVTMKVRANGRTLAPPYHIYAAEGSWKGLREIWKRLVKKDLSAEIPYLEVRRRRPLSFGFSQELIFPSLGPVQGVLEISNLRAKEATGSVRILTPKGWTAKPSDTNFQSLNWEKEHRQTISFIPPPGIHPGVYEGRLVLQTDEFRRESRFPIILLGQGDVNIRHFKDQGRKVIEVSNGTIEFKVCPSFGGIVYSLARNGVEYLESSFGKPCPRLWYNPWFGGLSASIGHDPSRIWQESFTSTPVQEGLWKGVETCCQPGKFAKRVKGLIVKSRYMTTNASNILKLEQVVSNPGTATMNFQSWVRIFPGIGKRESVESVIHDEDDRPFARPWKNKSRYFQSDKGWVAVRNVELDSSLVFSGPVSQHAYVCIQEARGLTEISAGIDQRLEPKDSSRWSWYLALCSSNIDDIGQHRHIKQLSPNTKPLQPNGV